MGRVAHVVGIDSFRFAERDGDETIDAIIARLGWRFRLPTIVVVKGEPILRREWATRLIAANDDVDFISRPRGGGGRSALAIAAMIAIAVAATVVAGPIGIGAVGAVTGLSTTAGVLGVSYAAIAASAAAAAIAVGGSLLVNAFLMPDPATSTDNSGDPPPALIGAAGNQARPFGAIPVGYGRTLSYPPYGAPPYSEFENNKQRLYTLLCLGLGKYEIEAIRAEDTIFYEDDDVTEDFEDGVKVEIIPPGGSIDLFPFNVTTSVEVSNTPVPGDPGNDWGDYVGPFIVNAADTEAKTLIIDWMLPGGLFGLNAQGKPTTRQIKVQADYQEVDADGDPVGGWHELIDRTLTKRTREAQRFTERKDVSPARYQVRMRRNKEELGGADGFDQVVWYALRAHLVANRTFPDTTMIAISWDTEDAAVAETVQRRIGVVSTRILPVWDAVEEEWLEEPTRLAEWAAADIFTNDVYSFGAPNTDIDLETFSYYAEQAIERGDTFDHFFTSSTKVRDALKTALRVRRAQPIELGHKLTMVRDEPRSVPTGMLTDREIVRGSFENRVVFQDDETADDVIVEFLNEETLEADEVRITLVGSDSLAPARVRIDGITNHAHAWREGRYLAAVNRYRRQYPSVDTEHDGRLLLPGDVVRLQSEIPDRWGQAAQVIDADIPNRRLTLDPAPEWSETPTQDYIEIRTAKGRRFGPVKCSEGAAPNIAVLQAGDLADVEADQGMSLTQALARKDGADLPSVVVGRENRQCRDAVVLAFEPSGKTGRLSMVLDDARVHEADETEVEPTPNEPAPKPPNRPQLYALKARIKQRGNDATLEASWVEAYGAKHYIAEVSSEEDDSDRSWTRIWKGTDTGFELPVDEIATKIRVAAVGKLRGPWVEQAISFPDYLAYVPALTLTPIIREGRRDAAPGVRVEWEKPPRAGYEGIVLSWWPEGDDTKPKQRVIRSRERLKIDIFEGIGWGDDLEVVGEYSYQGGLQGPPSDPEDGQVTALDRTDLVEIAVGDNAVFNESFEKSDDATLNPTEARGWTQGGDTGFLRETGNAEHGNWAMRHDGAGSATIEPTAEHRKITRENQRWTATVEMKITGGATFTAAGLRIIFRDKDGTIIPSTGTFTTQVASLTGTYEPIRVLGDVAVAPPGTYTVNVRLFVSGQSASGKVWWDSVSLRRNQKSRDLEDGAATEAKLGAAAVTETKIGSGAVVAAKIGTGAVEEAKIAANAVVAAKIASGAVEEAKIGTGAVTNGKLGAGAVTNVKIGNGEVDDAKISGVTATKVAVGSGSRKLSENVDTAGRVKEDGVADDAIVTAKVKAKNLTLVHLANESTVSMDVDIQTSEVNITPGENNQSFATVTISCRKGSKVLLSGTALMRSQSGGDTSTDVEIVCVTDSNRLVQKWGSVGNTQLRVSHAFITMDSPPGSLFGGGDDDVANIQYRLRGTSVSGLVNTLITDRSLVAQNAKQAT